MEWAGNYYRGFGNKIGLIFSRWGAIEVDLNDLRHSGVILDILGFAGAWRLHLGNTKIPLALLSGSPDFSFPIWIRNAILKQNATTWGKYRYYDNPDWFPKSWTHPGNCDPLVGRFVCGFRDCLQYLAQLPGYSLKTNISELQDLMRRQPIERKDGALEDRILNVIRYGNEQKYESPVKLKR